MKYIAVDQPAYLAMNDYKGQRPTTDEDISITDTIVVAKNADYANACAAMADRMTEIANMDHVIRANESVTYQAAALIFANAPRARYPQDIAFRISGRCHSVQEMTS